MSFTVGQTRGENLRADTEVYHFPRVNTAIFYTQFSVCRENPVFVERGGLTQVEDMYNSDKKP